MTKISCRLAEDGILYLQIPNDRPDTLLGTQSQGDHVTAYAFMAETLRAAVEDVPIDTAIGKVVNIIDILNPPGTKHTEENMVKVDESFELARRTLRSKSVMTSKDYEFIKQSAPPARKEEMIEAFNRANSNLFTDTFAEIAENHVLLLNQQVGVSFPREGSIAAPKGDGGRIRWVMTRLRDLNYLKDSYTDEHVDKIVNDITNGAFYYPHIPDDQLVKDQELETWKKKHPNYLPRDNLRDSFEFVMTRHMQLTFLAFPKFGEDPKTREKIIDKFADKICGSEGWNQEVWCNDPDFKKGLKDKIKEQCKNSDDVASEKGTEVEGAELAVASQSKFSIKTKSTVQRMDSDAPSQSVSDSMDTDASHPSPSSETHDEEKSVAEAHSASALSGTPENVGSDLPAVGSLDDSVYAPPISEQPPRVKSEYRKALAAATQQISLAASGPIKRKDIEESSEEEGPKSPRLSTTNETPTSTAHLSFPHSTRIVEASGVSATPTVTPSQHLMAREEPKPNTTGI